MRWLAFFHSCFLQPLLRMPLLLGLEEFPFLIWSKLDFSAIFWQFLPSIWWTRPGLDFISTTNRTNLEIGRMKWFAPKYKEKCHFIFRTEKMYLFQPNKKWRQINFVDFNDEYHTSISNYNHASDWSIQLHILLFFSLLSTLFTQISIEIS